MNDAASVLEPAETVEPPAEPPEPARNAWALSPNVIPCLDGAPLSEEKAVALAGFVTGSVPCSPEVWEERIRRCGDPSRRGALEIEREWERRAALATCKGLWAVVLKLFGEIPGVELRTADGALVDVESLNCTNVDVALRGPHNAQGWGPNVPRLREGSAS